MKYKTAKEYIWHIDSTLGESWSDDTEKIADIMEDYAKMYYENKLELLGVMDIHHIINRNKKFTNEK